MKAASEPSPAPHVEGANLIYVGTAPRIAVEYIGNGPLVFLLHGIGSDRSSWVHQLLHLSSIGYCAAAWDARGYGDSDDYDGPLSFTDMADDLSRVLDAFAVDRSHIVGTSMGGRISLETYAHFPDRFASLTLAGVHASFGSFSEEAQRDFVATRRKPLLEEGCSPADLAPTVTDRLLGPNASEDARSRAIAAMSRLHVNSYIKTVEETTKFDRGHVLSEIRIPTQVIGGEYDLLTMPDFTKKVAEEIEGAEYHLMYDVGHLGNLESPVEFNRLITQFISRYRDRANFAADPRILIC